MHRTVRVFVTILATLCAQPALTATIRYDIEAGGTWGSLNEQGKAKGFAIDIDPKSEVINDFFNLFEKQKDSFQYVSNSKVGLVLNDLDIISRLEYRKDHANYSLVRVMYFYGAADWRQSHKTLLEAIKPHYLPLAFRKTKGFPV